MTNFDELLTQDMRLVILRSIADDGLSLNESLIQEVLELYGHAVSRDRVRTEMRWLEEQHLITIEAVSGIFVGRLTRRGLDVAMGRARIDGVKRPSPRT